jgi:hypothetical protein
MQFYTEEAPAGRSFPKNNGQKMEGEKGREAR